MSIEGLEYILEKREVVPTVSARDLLDRAEQVEADYRRHVRTYVPISRATEGNDGQLSVEAFEQRVISRIKNARAPRGYLTAEFGYGKTSTALYLWERAEQEGLVVVPPFQMQQLVDVVTATHGWLRYRIGHTHPGLVARVNALYEATTQRSIAQAAADVQGSEEVVRRWVLEGRYILSLQTADYLQYFEEATRVAKDAGYQGLLLLPDEIQQYIEPQLHSGAGDPIAPFFNLIQGLATREGYLCFGLVMVIPRKEIGVIREARGRGDLLDRMREISLDLSAVYDQGFARRLWDRLAKEFGYADVASQIARPETLDAIGEIASRDDLSNGPRTVVNAFRRMVRRYVDAGFPRGMPYTPVDLVDDLLQGQIDYSGNDQIQNVTRRVLQSALVRADFERLSPAVKLAAAYPSDGVPSSLQRRYGVTEPLEDLKRAALGDLVISVGPIEENGVTLLGLQRGQQTIEWLPLTIREFRRAYSETHDDTRERAIEVFERILETSVFARWKVVERRASTYTSNRGIIFQGEFPAFAARFPNRKVHVRIVWEDEEDKDGQAYGDVLLEYRLSLHRDTDPEERRHLAQEATLDTARHTAHIPINLLYVRPEGVAEQIRQALQGVWSPYDLSPLVLMNIHRMLDEKREQGLVPKRDDQFVVNGFQPDLLENVIRDLFCPEVGAQLDAAGERMVEVAVERLLDARYGATYSTLMSVASWKSSLQKYMGALERLENRHQRQGAIPVEGTKKGIADLMTLSNTGLDSFMRSFGNLLSLESEWPTQKQMDQGEKGTVRFNLHPQERTIMEWLRASSVKRDVAVGGTTERVSCLDLAQVYTRSEELGYQGEEVEQLIALLGRRELAEVHQQYRLCELPPQGPPVQDALALWKDMDNDLVILLEGFPSDNTLVSIRTHAGPWGQRLEDQLSSETPDAELVHRLTQNIRLRQNEIRDLAHGKRQGALEQLNAMLRGLRQVNPQQLEQIARPIEGTVSYVDQVNALRMALHHRAQSVQGSIAGYRLSLEQSAATLRREELKYQELVAQVVALRGSAGRQSAMVAKVNEVDTFFGHLAGWARLVTQGSSLIEELNQMENVTEDQALSFDRLCRDIRGDISSQADKLQMLPNHNIYETRLAEIAREVRKIREAAIAQYSTRQNLYRATLENSAVYKRDQLWQPFQFNFSNPGESSRLLEAEVSRLVVSAGKQMQQHAVDFRHTVENILSTPYLKDLTEEDRQRITADGDDLLAATQQLLDDLVAMQSDAEDRAVITDLTDQGEGRFPDLIRAQKRARDALGDIDRETRELGRWLRQFELSPEQEEMLQHLSPGDLASAQDLIEWRRRLPLFTDEQFWANLRGLYDKRRISLAVSQVRV